MALYSGFYNELYDFIRFILSKAQLRTLLLAMPKVYVDDTQNGIVIKSQHDVISNDLLVFGL
jgi:hypothetical protein